MTRIRTRLAMVLPLSTGLVAGLLLAGPRPARLSAESSSSRSGECVSVAGPVEVQQHPIDKGQITHDGVYWLDYRAARLFAAIPDPGVEFQTLSGVSKVMKKLDPRRNRPSEGGGSPKKVVESIAERELIRDFGLKPGVEPHFLMNTASLGTFGGGEAALYVFETTTKQVAVYRVVTGKVGAETRTRLDLVQLKGYAPPLPQDAPAEGVGRHEDSISTSGPVILQPSQGSNLQVPLDAVYWADSRSGPLGDGWRLYSTIPIVRKIGARTEILSGVAERDLAADFELKPGANARFIMNTASLGAMVRGAAALMVFETTTKQVAVYHSTPRATANDSTPVLELIQLTSYVQPPVTPAAE
jgi:hypothetical protein